MEEWVAFGSRAHWVWITVLTLVRGADLLSTWIATPNLVLEGNPLARRLGWHGSLILNVIVIVFLSVWPLPSAVVATTSLMLAARNLHSAWLMRSMGESRYRVWFVRQVSEARIGWYLACVLGQSGLNAILGAVLVYFAGDNDLVFAIGVGVLTYALAITFYTLISLRRLEWRS